MAETNWTQAQLEAIRTQDANVLVSAAAGSGKTAVLTERVIRMITREEDPLDLDSMLIMTFTRAAASQMKTKIFHSLKEALNRQPQRQWLRQQLMKVQNAKICTIDSFCLELVREHFQETDLDPGFQIADEAEIRLLKKEVLSRLLEQKYREGSEEFLELAEYYADRNDKKLEEILLTLHQFSESHPEPLAWLRACVFPYQQAADLYAGETPADYPEGMDSWMDAFADLVDSKLEEISGMAQDGERISLQNYGPEPYAESFREIQEFVQNLKGQSLDMRRYEICSFLSDWKRAPVISRKNTDVDETLKTAAQDLRKEIKKRLEELRDDFLYDDLEPLFRDMADCASVAAAISELAVAFSEELQQAKKQRMLADFSDIAHQALRILFCYENDRIKKDAGGSLMYTETADLLAKSFRQIIVDEYQDTNLLQEYLVRALSSERFGNPDVFMVGDVKQSIYGFRMACPELFTRKMELYRKDPQQGKLIILDRNFRSRKEVLDLTNLVFSQTMIREVGGINYSEGHGLTYGGLYDTPEAPAPEGAFLPELYFLEGSGEEAKYSEGYLIARRIEQLAEEGRFALSDMVILTRASDQPQLEKVLRERGISFIKNSGSGFFDSFEIRLTLNLLQVIDNPFQDIPMAAVLYSPLCSASPAQLAKLRLCGAPTDSLYVCLKNDPEEQFAWFLEKLSVWRSFSVSMGLSDFLAYVLKDSGLDAVFAAMPLGEERLFNLEFLKSKARAFARGSCQGLSRFLRYVQELKESQLDFGSVNSAASSGQAVRIMTIHRSKGLEFPVVFLALCGKKFNESDVNASITPDRQLGLGLELRDPQSRLVRRTAIMQTIRQKQKNDCYAEEMRLLYVALTRAKEKLIITGSSRQIEGNLLKWAQEQYRHEMPLEAYKILRTGSFLKLLGLSLHRWREQGTFSLQYPDALAPEEERVQEVQQLMALRESLIQAAKAQPEDPAVKEALSYCYPYRNAAGIQGKIAASSLERHDRQEAVQRNAEVQEPQDLRLGPGELLTGAQRGTAYHTFLEFLEYDRDIEEQIRQFTEDHRLTQEEAAVIRPEKIRAFLQSPLGARMGKAFREGKLHREMPFVIGYQQDINGTETLTGLPFRSDTPDEELLLVQGIIDAWFTETGPDGKEQIILVDYKTDRNRDEEYYIYTYSPQLNAYADALERNSGLTVAEKTVYSLELDRSILIPEESSG